MNSTFRLAPASAPGNTPAQPVWLHGTCVAPVGEQPPYAGGDIIVVRASEQDPVYLAHLLNAPVAVRQKTRMAQGNAVVQIRGDDLADVDTRLRSRPEHRAIAPVLSGIDAEIIALKRRPDETPAASNSSKARFMPSSSCPWPV